MWPFKKKPDWKGLFDQGMTYGRSGDLDGAAASFREATRLEPAEPYPHYELGFTLFLRGRVREALSEFQHTEELCSGFFLVQTYIDVCARLLSGSLTPEGSVLFQKLQWLADLGRPQGSEARELAEALVRACPTFPVGHYCLGIAVSEDDPARAETALGTCLELTPDPTTAIDALFHLGVLRNKAGDRQGARRLWQSAIDRYPRNIHTKFCEINLAATESA